MARNQLLKQYIADDELYSHYIYKNQVNYFGQKSMAKKRNIEWFFTFDTWIEWWVNTGHFNERGLRNDQYQMCRINDDGPYCPTNVYCDLGINNRKNAYVYDPQLRLDARQRAFNMNKKKKITN